MEPAQAPIVKYLVFSMVKAVKEEFIGRWVTGVGKEAQFVPVSKGWFLFLEGSYEAIHMGGERPPFESGDRIKITFEKVRA